MAAPTTLFATGDLVTAAQLNSFPIALAEGSGAAASYDFTSIPQVWTHLLFICSLQTGAGAIHDDVKVTFNGDTGAHYYEERGRATGATASAQEQIANAAVRVGSVSGQTNGGFSSTTFWIPNYATVQPHNCHSNSFSALGTSTGNLRMEQYGGLWKPVADAAINRVTVFPGAGSFVAGSIATLYGLGAV
jgi:hypothetical protein